MKYCNKCGRMLNDVDVFCSACGSQQGPMQPVQTPNYMEPNYSKGNPVNANYVPVNYPNGDSVNANYAPVNYPNGNYAMQNYGQQEFEATDIVWFIVSLFLFWVGIIAFLVYKDTKPKTSKMCLIGSLVSFALSIILVIVIACAMAMA